MQPGSSCITSLTESETKPKKIALVEIKGKNFRVNPIVIPNMRKFVFKSIALCNYKQLDPASPAIANDIEAVLDDEMEGILHQIQNEAKLPLVRLAVDATGGAASCALAQEDATGFPSIPVQIYGAKFVGKIANPNTLLYWRRKHVTSASREPGEAEAGEIVSGMAQFDMMSTMIENSLKEMGGLTILSNRHMHEACLCSWPE